MSYNPKENPNYTHPFPYIPAEYLEGKFHGVDHRKVRLGKKATKEVLDAWIAYQEYIFNCDVPGMNTRALYNEKKARGKYLVEIQAKHGVWLIHPVNATAGLRPDDPRII